MERENLLGKLSFSSLEEKLKIANRVIALYCSSPSVTLAKSSLDKAQEYTDKGYPSDSLKHVDSEYERLSSLLEREVLNSPVAHLDDGHFFYLFNKGLPLMLCWYMKYECCPVKADVTSKRFLERNVPLELNGIYRFVRDCVDRSFSLLRNAEDETEKGATLSSEKTAQQARLSVLTMQENAIKDNSTRNFIKYLRSNWIYTVHDLLTLDGTLLGYLLYSEKHALQDLNILEMIKLGVTRLKREKEIKEIGDFSKLLHKAVNQMDKEKSLESKIDERISLYLSENTIRTVEAQPAAKRKREGNNKRRDHAKKQTQEIEEIKKQKVKRLKSSVNSYNPSAIRLMAIKGEDAYKASVTGQTSVISYASKGERRGKKPDPKIQKESLLIVQDENAAAGSYFCLACKRAVGPTYVRRHASSASAPLHKQKEKVWVRNNLERYKESLFSAAIALSKRGVVLTREFFLADLGDSLIDTYEEFTRRMPLEAKDVELDGTPLPPEMVEKLERSNKSSRADEDSTKKSHTQSTPTRKHGNLHKVRSDDEDLFGSYSDESDSLSDDTTTSSSSDGDTTSSSSDDDENISLQQFNKMFSGGASLTGAEHDKKSNQYPPHASQSKKYKLLPGGVVPSAVQCM